MMNEAWGNLLLAVSLPQGFPDTNGHFGLASQKVNHPYLVTLWLATLRSKIFPICIPPSLQIHIAIVIYIHIYIYIWNLSKTFKPPWNHWFFLHHFLTASTKHRSARSMAVDVPRSGRRTPCWRMCGVGETRELDSKSEGYLPQVEWERGCLGGGGFRYFLYFHPEKWGRWSHFDVHIFQMGWNHQLVVVYVIYLYT